MWRLGLDATMERVHRVWKKQYRECLSDDVPSFRTVLLGHRGCSRLEGAVGAPRQRGADGDHAGVPGELQPPRGERGVPGGLTTPRGERGLVIATISGFILEKLKLQRYVAEWVYKVKANQAELQEEKLKLEDRIQIGFDTVKEIVGKIWIYILIGIGVGAGAHGYEHLQ